MPDAAAPRADEMVVDGIETTLPLFRALVRESAIIDGDYHIHWLEQYLASAATPSLAPPPGIGRPRGPHQIRPFRAPAVRLYLGTMTSRDNVSAEITPEVLLRAYACGIFPMAESADDPTLFWVEPEQRGVIPLDGFHISSRLARTVRSDRFTVTVNRAFTEVIDGCAAPGWAAETPGSTAAFAISIRLCTTRPLPQRRSLGRRPACRRPLRRLARRRVLRREHVPSRARCVKGRARTSRRAADRRRLRAARHAVRHRPFANLRRGRSAAPALHGAAR